MGILNSFQASHGTMRVKVISWLKIQRSLELWQSSFHFLFLHPYNLERQRKERLK